MQKNEPAGFRLHLTSHAKRRFTHQLKKTGDARPMPLGDRFLDARFSTFLDERFSTFLDARFSTFRDAGFRPIS